MQGATFTRGKWWGRHPLYVFAPRFQFTYYYFFFKATPRPAGRGAPGYLAPGWGSGAKEAEETKKNGGEGGEGGGHPGAEA